MAQAWVYDNASGVGWRTMVEGDLPASGATAGTYGDATHVSQVTVNAEGFVTAASSVAISASGSPLTTKGDIYGYDTADARIPVGTDGYVLTADSSQALGVAWAAAAGASGLPVLYSTTLAAQGPLDTGAGGIASGHGDILITCLLQSNHSAATDLVRAYVNGAGSAYDQSYGYSSSAGSSQTNQSNWSLAGYVAGTAINYGTTLVLFIPGYDDTNYAKSGIAFLSTPGHRASWVGVGWNTSGGAAINQFKIAPSSGSAWMPNSRMVVYGLQ